MSGYPFAVVLCIVLVVLVIQLLRTRRIREKYAGAWIVLALGVVVVGLFPQIVFSVAGAIGVETPINMLFALGFVVLLGVCIQLSASTSSLEERVRTLTEEIALLRMAEDQPSTTATPSSDEGPPSQDD
ncbi:DUF2304 domain-containing protein [Oerskovia sp. KBS0722]|uniref:DUF2304 domain-containing protein n=1 Tax=Oerskovia sp. KBS0722 TaxID=1179673 RepID=UPI00110DD7E2|nr:DUF2304 domain-containing protein [Oerskovia sp. KBS0722]QDW64160.1 DUF2304 family protein [Oerskovia sp. KBS0722]